jgi:hypothetical protein
MGGMGFSRLIVVFHCAGFAAADKGKPTADYPHSALVSNRLRTEQSPARAHAQRALKRKNPVANAAGFWFRSLAVSYFRMAAATLSSALSVFTSEFEMGSGGSRSLWPPGKLVKPSARAISRADNLIRKTAKALGLLLLLYHTQIAWVLYGQASRSISTG